MSCTPGRIGCQTESHASAIEDRGESVRAVLWDGEALSDDASVRHTRPIGNTWGNKVPSDMSDLAMDVEEHLETGYNFFHLFKGHVGLGLRNLWNQDPSVLRSDTNREDPWSTLNTRSTRNHTPYIPIQLAGQVDQNSGSNTSVVSYNGHTELDSSVSNGLSSSTITTSVDEEEVSVLQSTSIVKSEKYHPDSKWAHDLATTPPVTPVPSIPDYDTDTTVSSGLSCPYENCEAQFIGAHCKESLVKHIRTQHDVPKTFRCWEMGCGKAFRLKDAQLAHIRRHHPGLAPSPAACFDPRLVNSIHERKPQERLFGTWITPETEDAGFEVLSDSGKYSEPTSAQSSNHDHKGNGRYLCPKVIDPPIQSAPVVQSIERVHSGALENAAGDLDQTHKTVQSITDEILQNEEYTVTYDQSDSTLSLSHTCPKTNRDSDGLLPNSVRTTTIYADNEHQLVPKENSPDDLLPGLGSEHGDASYYPLEDMDVVLDESQQKIVKQAMARFHDWFSHSSIGVLWPEKIAQHRMDRGFGSSDVVIRDHTFGTSGGTYSSDGRVGERQQTTQQQPSNVLGKRKVGNTRDGSGDNNDEDYPNKHPEQNSRSKAHSKSASRFACPFFKRNPERPKRPACFSSGFENITRMKQHIYRAHKQLLLCPRCEATVGDHQGLMTHLQIVGQCDPSNRTPTAMKHDSQDTIDQSKEEEIRKLPLRGLTEPEKWANLYRLIFNLDETAQTPSPYYEHPSTRHSSTTTSDSSRDSSRMEVYNDRFPLILQSLITQAVEEETKLLRENLNAQIPWFVKTARQLWLQEVEASTRSSVSLGLSSQSSSSREPTNLQSNADSLLEPSSGAATSTGHIIPPRISAQIGFVSTSLPQSSIPSPWAGSAREPKHHSPLSSNDSSIPTNQIFLKQISNPQTSKVYRFSEQNTAGQLCGHSQGGTPCDGSTSSCDQQTGIMGNRMMPPESGAFNYLPKSIGNTPTMSLASNTTQEDMGLSWTGDATNNLTGDPSATPPLGPPTLSHHSNSEDERDHTLNSDSCSNMDFNIEEPGPLSELFIDQLFDLPKSLNWFSPPDEV